MDISQSGNMEERPHLAEALSLSLSLSLPVPSHTRELTSDPEDTESQDIQAGRTPGDQGLNFLIKLLGKWRPGKGL